MSDRATENQNTRGGRILIVDDDPAFRMLQSRILERDYEVRTAEDGVDAIELATVWPPDLILLDVVMPRMNGYEACSALKKIPFEHPPQVIMVSAKSNANEQVEAFDNGADDYLTKPVDRGDLRARVELHFRLRKTVAHTARMQAQIEAQKVSIERSAREKLERILAVQDIAVLALAKVAESRDNETGEHIVRMRDYACHLAKLLRSHPDFSSQLSDEFLADLYRSAPLHDIGKVGIPDSVLLKPGKLTEGEFEVMKRHTTIGAAILDDLVMHTTDAGFLSMSASIARFHHERWDGRGYPAGLSGEEIPLPARIVSVADVFDALTSERPYKEAWPTEKALNAISEGADTQFDGRIVDAFVGNHRDFVEIQNDYSNREPLIRGAMAFCEYDLATYA